MYCSIWEGKHGVAKVYACVTSKSIVLLYAYSHKFLKVINPGKPSSNLHYGN